MAGGRYGGLRDEVPRGDVEWDVGGGEEDLEEFGITPPRGVRRGASERSRGRRDEEVYMEGVRREHLRSAYMEEPRRSHMDTAEELEVAAVGVRGGRRWEPRFTSRPAFMVSKAADAAVWEDLKDIKSPTYDGNPLNLDCYLQKLDDWGMTVTEDMDPAEAEKYVFKRFRWRLPEELQELYFVATKEGKIKTLNEAKKWLNEQERVDAPQMAAKRWRAIKLQHDGRDIRLRDWRDFRGQYSLFRRNVEDWNEGDEQARLLSMLPEALIKRVTKEVAKRAKFPHTFKMMLPGSIIQTFWLGQKSMWRGMSSGETCGTPSSSPSRAIARRPRCCALTSVTWAARPSVEGRPCGVVPSSPSSSNPSAGASSVPGCSPRSGFWRRRHKRLSRRAHCRPPHRRGPSRLRFQLGPWQIPGPTLRQHT